MTGGETGTTGHPSSLCSPPRPAPVLSQESFPDQGVESGQTDRGVMLVPPARFLTCTMGMPPPPSPSGRESEPMSVKHLRGPGPGSWLTWLCPVRLAVTLGSDPSALPQCPL